MYADIKSLEKIKRFLDLLSQPEKNQANKHSHGLSISAFGAALKLRALTCVCAYAFRLLDASGRLHCE